MPSLDVLDKYGIKMEYRISPNVFEQGRIYKAAKQKKIYQQRDFPVIMKHIIEESKELGHKYDE